MPWILLHAVCFIGATFCDLSVIYKSSFKSRFHARRTFYDKAKVLFDVGYEVDKFTLLQTVIMLSFWGPQMKSYWTPCSWVGFGATIAESLGIHRATSSLHATGKDKSLVKRLWWSLAVRDAYCASLLGRPFRINMSQCDTEMLELDDFQSEVECSDQALYQIHVAKLSLIVRRIMEKLCHGSMNEGDSGALRELLNTWQAQTPAGIQWSTGTAPNSVNIFATSLKLLYQHHNILIHLGRPGDHVSAAQAHATDSVSASIAQTAAQVISSTAAMLVTKHITHQLPHEVFAGFFVAGIVFFRQQQQPDGPLVHMARASLDNCQMLLNEIRGSWDPAHWVLRIFDFLLSSAAGTATPNDSAQQQGVIDMQSSLDAMPLGMDVDSCFPQDAGMLHPVDWDSPNQALNGNFNDFLLMPSFFMPTPG
jgi:hypothetical protein